MRDLEAIKNKRNELRSLQVKLVDKKRSVRDGEKINELDEYDQKVYYYLQRSLREIEMQINTLTFCLNEDTELHDICEFQDKMHRCYPDVNYKTIFNEE